MPVLHILFASTSLLTTSYNLPQYKCNYCTSVCISTDETTFLLQYLATPESQSLRCDLIRFIVGVIHPTNELLCSDIIPRWAVIGWLLTTCTSSVAASNAKLALFYDWLFFEADKDNIMNIGQYQFLVC